MAPAARLSLANPGGEQKELAPTYNYSAQCAGLSPVNTAAFDDDDDDDYSSFSTLSARRIFLSLSSSILQRYCIRTRHCSPFFRYVSSFERMSFWRFLTFFMLSSCAANLVCELNARDRRRTFLSLALHNARGFAPLAASICIICPNASIFRVCRCVSLRCWEHFVLSWLP